MFRFTTCSALILLSLTSLAGASEIVTMETNYGSFSIELYEAAAPNTCANFLSYVNSGAYNNSIFDLHREDGVVSTLRSGGVVLSPAGTDPIITPIIQGPTIANEFNPAYSNIAGTVSMSKPADDPDGAKSRWTINLADNSDYFDTHNGGYTVFGHIISGWDVIQAIAALPVWNFGPAYPLVPVGTGFTEEQYEAGNMPAQSDLVTIYSATPGVSTPEPATMSLLAISGLALLRRRKTR